MSWDYVLYDFLLNELRKGTSSIELAGYPLFIAKMRPASARHDKTDFNPLSKEPANLRNR
jgi:hypothetical protein